MEKTALITGCQKRNVLSCDPETDILIGLSGHGMFSNKGFTLIGGNDHVFIIWDSADQIHGKDVHDIFQGHHIACPDHIEPDTVDVPCDVYGWPVIDR